LRRHQNASAEAETSDSASYMAVSKPSVKDVTNITSLTMKEDGGMATRNLPRINIRYTYIQMRIKLSIDE